MNWNHLFTTLAGEIYAVDREALRAALEQAHLEPWSRVSSILVRNGLLNPEQDEKLSAIVDSIFAESRELDTTSEFDGATFLSSADDTDSLGARYLIRSEHARGGIGRILVAWDRELEREVALKELLAAPASAAAARFLREARITARLEHPAIVPIHEIVKRSDNSLYYTMKLVRGTTLRQAIAECSTTSKRLRLLPHFLDICQAIAYAHSRGVVHRDIKPSNVMIGAFGETLVIDWGMAKDSSESVTAMKNSPDYDTDRDAAAAVTVAGQIIGTPNYMAPEQARGEIDRLDERSDIFSLGAVLYELLCGKAPYDGHSREDVLARAMNRDCTPIDHCVRDAPAALIAVCEKAMQRRPEDRYASAADLAAEIARFQSGLLVHSHRYGLVDRAAHFVRLHRALVSSAALLFILLATSVYAYVTIQQARSREVELFEQSEKQRYDVSMARVQRYMDEGNVQDAVTVLNSVPRQFRNWEWGRFQYIFNEAELILTGHGGVSVWTCAISPDGRLLVTADELQIILWDLQTGKELKRKYVPHTSSIDFHPDGREFVLSNETGKAYLWDLESFSVTKTLVGHASNTDVTAVRYTPGGDRIVTAGKDGRVIVWDRASGDPLRSWAVDGAVFMRMDVDPAANVVAAGLFDGRVYVWELNSGAELLGFDAHAAGASDELGGVLAIAFRDGQNQLATSGADGAVRLWNLESGELVSEFLGHSGKVTSVDFSPDGNSVITAGLGATVRVWDLETGDEIPAFNRFPFHVNKAAFTPSGDGVVICSRDGTASVWPAFPRRGEFVLQGHTDEVVTLAFSPDDSMLLSGAGVWIDSVDTTAILWDTASGALRHTLTGHEQSVFSVDFLTDKRAITGSRDHGIFVWDTEHGKAIREIESIQHYKSIRSLAFSPDGRYFLVEGSEEEGRGSTELVLWSVENGMRIRRLHAAGSTHESGAAFSPDGALAAAGTGDGLWQVWKVDTGEMVLRSPMERAESTHVLCFTPNGRRLATAGRQSPLRLWDVATGQLLRTFVTDGSGVEDVAFSPDGKRLASCNSTGVRVMDDTGVPFAAFPFPARKVEFSHDGLMLAAGGMDGTVRLWKALPWDEEYDDSYWTESEVRIQSSIVTLSR